MEPVISILGAGLTGPLLAIYLAKRGYSVDLYERRADMRKQRVERGRSINLALSTRGIHALHAAGIGSEVLAEAIPMHGRMIHDRNGTQELQPYGKSGQYINSVSRAGLNMALMNAAERFDNVRIHFNAHCTHVDLDTRVITLLNDGTGQATTKQVERLIGCDGAGSALRVALEPLPEVDTKIEWLEHGYKELSIPAAPDGGFQMEKNALHIWPRGNFMMIALPNPDGTFTCTLFAPHKGPDSFEHILDDHDVMRYFHQNFVDAVHRMPTLLDDWHHNPKSDLATVYCDAWYYQDWALLAGDAAHAVVPFYGQGMNCCFEDCFVFDQIAAETSDWGTLIKRFYQSRKPNSDAIARLALENFVEMRSKVVDPDFLRKKSVDNALNDMFRDKWMPLYSMVTFSTLPYSEALERSQRQDALLEKAGLDNVEQAIADGPDAVRTLLGIV